MEKATAVALAAVPKEQLGAPGMAQCRQGFMLVPEGRLTVARRFNAGHCSLDILHIPSVAQGYRGKVGACRQGLAPKARSIPAQGNPAKREPPWVAGAKSSAALQGRRPMVLRPADATADGAKGSLCRGWRAEYGLRPCRALVPSRISTQGGALPRLPWAGLLHAAGVRNVQTPEPGVSTPGKRGGGISSRRDD
jgi:hypothetical protein